MRRFFWIATVLFGLLLVSPAIPSAVGCPMCQAAVESSDALPRAYMYSILFMLTVPACFITGISVGLYRLSQREEAALAADVDEFGSDAT